MKLDPEIDSANRAEDASFGGIIECWRENGARTLSLMHVGADGWLKTLDFVPRHEDQLRAILHTGERADGSSLFAGSDIETEASDVLLRPRSETAFIDPFSEIPTLVVMCGHAGSDGEPLAQSPDTIVRRAAARLRETCDVDLWAHGEIEFFIGRADDGHGVFGADDRGYHAASPFVFAESLRRRALVCLSAMNIPVKYAHSEVGYIESREPGGIAWEQHEIELGLLPLPQAADAILLTQWVLRHLAQRSGMRCSMEPVVVAGHPGNGLHCHLSPRANRAPSPIRTSAGPLTPAAQWLIAGLVRTGPALMAFGNRSPLSFARLQQGREVPRRVMWVEYDRSALVRLPIVPANVDGSPAVTPTIEFRLPDGSAHPHLLLAGIAQAMSFGRTMPDLEQVVARTRTCAASPTADSPRASPSSTAMNTASTTTTTTPTTTTTAAASAAASAPERAPVAASLPVAPAEVGEALARSRAILEAGGVFPASWIERLIAELRGHTGAPT